MLSIYNKEIGWYAFSGDDYINVASNTVRVLYCWQ
jgi:hypothetical protein